MSDAFKFILFVVIASIVAALIFTVLQCLFHFVPLSVLASVGVGGYVLIKLGDTIF